MAFNIYKGVCFKENRKYATYNHRWITKPRIFTIGLSWKCLSTAILGHGCFVWKKFLLIFGWLLSPLKGHAWGGNRKFSIWAGFGSKVRKLPSYAANFRVILLRFQCLLQHLMVSICPLSVTGCEGDRRALTSQVIPYPPFCLLLRSWTTQTPLLRWNQGQAQSPCGLSPPRAICSNVLWLC